MTMIASVESLRDPQFLAWDAWHMQYFEPGPKVGGKFGKKWKDNKDAYF